MLRPPFKGAMSSPGVEPGPRPSQSRVRVRHTPRTTIGTEPLTSPPPGNRTRPCGFEGRRASATLAGKQPSALARSRTWSSTFGGSRAIPAHSKGCSAKIINRKRLTSFYGFHEFLCFAPNLDTFAGKWRLKWRLSGHRYDRRDQQKTRCGRHRALGFRGGRQVRRQQRR